MKLHELPGDPTLKKKVKRRGRGHASGLGKTAGKGHKGQQARSGGHKRNQSFEGGQMPLQRRLPKRGFSNVTFANKPEVINLATLNLFGEGATVDAGALHAIGAVRKGRPVKVLGNGSLSVKGLTVQAQAFSETARKAIEAAGGSCAVVPAKVRPTA